ncbi:MAG: ABC transporter permease [Chloroflexi bacterium]|nr:ABC transporter permease [Chloroflexota bacterium]
MLRPPQPGGTLPAVTLSLPLTVGGAQRLARAYAELSNVALASLALPWWVYLVVALAGLLAPLLAAAAPVVRASTATVREAIGEVGAYQLPTGGPGWALVVRALGPALVLALRNAFRRRARLLLSLSLLAVGGGTFMSGLNVAASSDRQLALAEATLTYDAELHLSRPEATERLLRLVRAVPGVAHVEPFGFASVAPAQPGEVPLARTYKDGGHGTLPLYAYPPDSRFQPEVLTGRWLEPGDTDAIVLAPGEFNRLGTAVGGRASFSLGGRTASWRVVGSMRGVGLGGNAGAFVSDAGFARVTGQDGSTQALRVLSTQRDPAGRKATQRAVEGALDGAGIGVANVVEADWWSTVLRNHVAIVQGALLSLGVVMGAVGTITLASAMSTSVVERTREFGVMQTLGATPARVTSIVVAEAVFIGALSWIGAVALAAALSSLVGALIGAWIYGAPLPLVVSPVAALAWLAIALLGSAAASAYPASAAARLTIRETLAYA